MENAPLEEITETAIETSAPLSDWESMRAAMIAAEKAEAEAAATAAAAAATPEEVKEVAMDAPAPSLEDASSKKISDFDRCIEIFRAKMNKEDARLKAVGATEYDIHKFRQMNTTHIYDHLDQCSDEHLRNALYYCTKSPRFAPGVSLEDAAKLTQTVEEANYNILHELGNAATDNTPAYQLLEAKLKEIGATVDECFIMSHKLTYMIFKYPEKYTADQLRTLFFSETKEPRFAPAHYTPVQKAAIRTPLLNQHRQRIPFRAAIMSPLKSKAADAVARPSPQSIYKGTLKGREVQDRFIKQINAALQKPNVHLNALPQPSSGSINRRNKIRNAQYCRVESPPKNTQKQKQQQSGVRIIMANKAKYDEFKRIYGVTRGPDPYSYTAALNNTLSLNATQPPQPTALQKVDLSEGVRAFADAAQFSITIKGFDKAERLTDAEKARQLCILNYEYDAEHMYPVASIAPADAEIIKGWYARCGIEFSIRETQTTIALDGLDIRNTPPLAPALSGKQALTRTQLPLFIAGLPNIVAHCKEQRRFNNFDVEAITRIETAFELSKSYIEKSANITSAAFYKMAQAFDLMATVEYNISTMIAAIDEQHDTVFHTMYVIDCENHTKQSTAFLKTLKTLNPGAHDKICGMFDDMRDIDIALYRTEGATPAEYSILISPAINYRMKKLRETCEQIAKYDAALLKKYDIDGLLLLSRFDIMPSPPSAPASNPTFSISNISPMFSFKSENESAAAVDATISREMTLPAPWDHLSNRGNSTNTLFKPEEDAAATALKDIMTALFEDNFAILKATDATKAIATLHKSAKAPKTLTDALNAPPDATATKSDKADKYSSRYIDDIDINIWPAGMKLQSMMDDGDIDDDRVKGRYIDVKAPVDVFDTSFKTTEDDNIQGAPYPSVYDDLTSENYPTLYDDLINNPVMTNAYPHLSTPQTRQFLDNICSPISNKPRYIVITMIHKATLSTVVESIELPTGDFKELVNIHKAGGLSRFTAPEYGFEKLFYYHTTDKEIVEAIRARFDGIAHFSSAYIGRLVKEILHVIDIQIHRAAITDHDTTTIETSLESGESIEGVRAKLHNYISTAFDNAAMQMIAKTADAYFGKMGQYRGQYTFSTDTNTFTIKAADILEDCKRTQNMRAAANNYLIIKRELIAVMTANGWAYDAATKAFSKGVDMTNACVGSYAPSPLSVATAYNPIYPLHTFEGALKILQTGPTDKPAHLTSKTDAGSFMYSLM